MLGLGWYSWRARHAPCEGRALSQYVPLGERLYVCPHFLGQSGVQDRPTNGPISCRSAFFCWLLGCVSASFHLGHQGYQVLSALKTKLPGLVRGSCLRWCNMVPHATHSCLSVVLGGKPPQVLRGQRSTCSQHDRRNGEILVDGRLARKHVVRSRFCTLQPQAFSGSCAMELAHIRVCARTTHSVHSVHGAWGSAPGFLERGGRASRREVGSGGGSLC